MSWVIEPSGLSNGSLGVCTRKCRRLKKVTTQPLDERPIFDSHSQRSLIRLVLSLLSSPSALSSAGRHQAWPQCFLHQPIWSHPYFSSRGEVRRVLDMISRPILLKTCLSIRSVVELQKNTLYLQPWSMVRLLRDVVFDSENPVRGL